MQSPSLILLSRLDTLSRNAEVVANNIANMSTTGFKQQEMLLETYTSRPEPRRPIDMVIDRGTARNLLPGALQNTGNPLDVALTGEGYFSVQTAQGIQYTRNGSFSLNADGQLVNLSGQTVLSADGAAINIPATAQRIEISRDGTIASEAGAIGQIGVFEFANPQELIETAGGLYRANVPPAAATSTQVIQGSIEQSNVNPINEMTALIETSRAYQRTQRLVDSEHERLRNANRTIARTN